MLLNFRHYYFSPHNPKELPNTSTMHLLHYIFDIVDISLTQ